MPWTNRTQATVNGVTTSYSWDARNRLTEATTPNGSLLFGYDINGIRTSRSENGITANFVVDHNQQYAQVLAEIENGFTAKQYTYGDDLLSQTDGARQERFFLYDGLGTTRALADGAEAVTDTYAYEAFGQLLATTGSSDNAYRYTGEQYDSGLDQYYLRARYYDQGVGRFTQMDTWMGRSRDPATLNKYAYSANDPVMHVDPSGNTYSLASFGAASNIQAALIKTAITVGVIGLAGNAVDNYGNTAGFGSSLDAVRAHSKVRSEVNAEAVRLAAASAITSSNVDEAPHNHHTIPVYMCGALNQSPNMVGLYGSTHLKLHGALRTYAVFMDTVYGAAFDSSTPMFESSSSRNKAGLRTLAGTKVGRQFIVGHLDAFYSLGWYAASPRFKPAFHAESNVFINNPVRNSLPSCKKP